MKRGFFVGVVMVGIAAMTGAIQAAPKQIYGYIERVHLVDSPSTLSLAAKMDTGAKSASIYATNIKKIKVNGKRYLRFHVPVNDKEILFEQPLLGYARIKTRAGEQHVGLVANAYRRPVVKMAVKLGNETREIRVNLADRGNFNYSLLMGREAIIKFNGVIDPSKKYLQSE